jgi:hypothetical protein
MADRHVTIVYTISDPAAFQGEWDRIGASLMVEGQPYSVTAVSRGHEIERVRLMAEAADRYADGETLAAAIRDLDACPDPASWDWDAFDAAES